MLKLSIFMILICAAFCALLIGYEYFRNRLGLNQPTPQPHPTSQVQFTTCGDDYIPFLESVLIPCVRDMYTECALAAPRSTASHIVPSSYCAIVHPKYGKVYCYDFKRQSYIEGGIRNLSTKYSTLPWKEIVKKINGVLPKYAIAAGYSPCVIVGGKDLENGVIRFVVGVAQ